MTEKKLAQTRERQKRRRARLDAIAQTFGYQTWTRYETACLEGHALPLTPTQTQPASIVSTDRSTD